MRGLYKLFYNLLLFLTFIIAGSCATVVEVGNDYDETTVFQSYNTYAWYSPTTTPGTGAAADSYSSELDFHIKRAVESGLVKNSLRPADATPDIYIAYDIVLPPNENIAPGSLAPGFRYGYSYWYGYRYDYGFANFPNSRNVETLSPGTIIVDIIDATTNQLVWRGWADAAIDINTADDNRINSIVASIMAQYPPLIGTSY